MNLTRILPSPRRGATSRAAVLACVAAVVGLTACTGHGGEPEVTGVPSTTSATLHVAALTGDPDAALAARADLLALRAAGLDAEMVGDGDGDAWEPKRAVAALGSGDVDILVGGASALAALPVTSGDAGSGDAGSADATAGVEGASSSAAQDGASDQQGQSAAAPPTDADAAVKAATAALPDGGAVAGSVLSDRRTVLVTSAATSAKAKVKTVAQAAETCHDSVLSIPAVWAADWYEAWSADVGCIPQDREKAASDAEALQDVLDGEARYGVARSSDPLIADWGLVALQDKQQGLGADPVVSIVRTQSVGRDAIDVMGEVDDAAQADPWDQLRRLTEGETGADLDLDVGRWLVTRKVVDGDDSGEPSTASPTGN